MDTEKQIRGRPFQKGNSGRKRGSKNRATLIATSLAGGQGEELLLKAIEMAMGGNVAMMKFLLDRILPKERSVHLELPALINAHDGVDAMAQIVDAVSSGSISPREAADVAQIVSAFTRAIEASDLEMEFDSLRSELHDLKADLTMNNSGENSKKR